MSETQNTTTTTEYAARFRRGAIAKSAWHGTGYIAVRMGCVVTGRGLQAGALVGAATRYATIEDAVAAGADTVIAL